MFRKVRHLGRKAAKYRFVVSLNQVTVKGTKAWQPHKLIVVLSRRKRKVSGNAQSWRPSIEDPYKGSSTWSGLNQQSLEFVVTLFEAQSFTGYDPKNWVFTVENEARDGKRKPISTVRVDMAQYVTTVPSPNDIELLLKPLTGKVKSAYLTCSITCYFLSAGPATEADLVSLAGSTASEDTIRLGDIDVGNIHDLDTRDFDNSHGNPFLEDSNENDANQQELRNLTSQIQSLNFAIGQQETTDFEVPSQAKFILDNESVASGSHTSSLRSRTSSASDRPPGGASSQFPNKGRSNSDAENVDKNSSELSEEANRRNSITSDSSTSSFQKRRLRPSADFLPTAHNECELSTTSAQNSPAPKTQKSLLRWCQRATAGYEGVKVTNFTTSWRNGLALCALLHHYKPEFINYESLSALEGRKNIKKALDAFKKLETTCDHSFPIVSVSNKNNLIAFLVAVRSFFKDDESPESTDDSSSDSRSSLHRNQHNLRGSTRVKLLSDLQEKEMEDDVFSAALDVALEDNKSPTTVESPISSGVFASGKKTSSPKTDDSKTSKVSRTRQNNAFDFNLSRKNDVKSESSSEKFSNSVLEKHSEVLRRKSSNSPKTPEEKTEKISVTNLEASSNTVCSNIISSNLDSSRVKNPTIESNLDTRVETTLKTDGSTASLETRNSPEISSKNPFGDADLEEQTNTMSFAAKTDETVAISSSEQTHELNDVITTAEPSKVPENETETIDDFLSELELKNPFDEDDPASEQTVTTTSDNESKVVETRDSPKIPLKNRFGASDMLTNDTDPVLDVEKSFAIAPEVTNKDQNKREINVSVHLPSSSQDIVRVKENRTSPTSELTEISYQPSEEERKESVSKPPFDGAPEPNSTVDVAAELSESKVSPSKKGDDFQESIQKLLKSSAERNRKAKALEIIAQTKADMASAKTVILSDEESKRQELIKERAQKLIEETRARLNKDKQNEPTSNVASSSNVIKVSSTNEINHNSPAKILSVLPCHSSTPKDHLFDERRADVRFGAINPDFRNQNRANSSPTKSPDFNQESIPPKNILAATTASIEKTDPLKNSVSPSSNPESADTVLLNKSKRVDSHQPSISLVSSVKTTDFGAKTKENRTFVDPLALSSEIPAPSTLDYKSSSIEEVSHPLAPSPSHIASNNMKKRVSNAPSTNEKTRSSINGDVFVDPLSVLNVEKMSLKNEFPHRKSSNVSGDANSSTSLDKISNPEEVEKRWSSMVKKSTSSVTVNGISEIEAEKRALEAEQRMVDERSSEVLLEIQDAKNAGGRANKRIEADLTQEWFQLVNKKNAILRQQDQLGLREEEQHILNQVEKLNDELIPLLSVEESMKTYSQRERETKLLEEKVRLVNERDKIIQLMNEKEQSAVDEDERIQTNISENVSQMMRQDEKCLVM